MNACAKAEKKRTPFGDFLIKDEEMSGMVSRFEFFSKNSNLEMKKSL